MELFTIQCTTCNVRLKVKDESFIGTIVNCPKCHGMVQIVPPIGWQRDGAAPSATEAAAGAASLSAAEASASASAPSAPPVPRAVAPPAVESPGVASPQGKPPMAETPVAPSSNPTPTAMSWRDTIVARFKTDWLLLTGGLATGIVAGVAAWWIIGAGSEVPDQIAHAAVPVQTTAAQAEPDQQDEPPEPLTAPAPTDDVELTATTDVAQPVAIETQPSAESSDGQTPAPPRSEATAAEPGTDASQGNEQVATDARAGAPVESSKPSLKLERAEKSEPTSNPLEVSTTGIAAPPSAGNLATSPDEAGAEPSPLDVEPADDAADAPETKMLSQSTVDERMSLTLGEVKFVGVPLAQFVDFVSDVTMLPITIDDAALAKAGKRRNMPVSVQVSDTTVQDALRSALAPLGLTYELRGNRLTVTVEGPR